MEEKEKSPAIMVDLSFSSSVMVHGRTVQRFLELPDEYLPGNPCGVMSNPGDKKRADTMLILCPPLLLLTS